MVRSTYILLIGVTTTFGWSTLYSWKSKPWKYAQKKIFCIFGVTGILNLREIQWTTCYRYKTICKQFTNNLKKREIQRKFLLEYRSYNVLPNHILNQTHINIRFFSWNIFDRIENSTKRFGNKILNNTGKATHISLKLKKIDFFEILDQNTPLSKLNFLYHLK